MATNFPTSLDTLTNPTATDTLDSPPHDTQHADANDAIEALQAKVGVDSSAVTTSLDYRVGQLELGGGSMTTSSTAPASPSDGDMWYDTDDGRTYVYYDDGTSQQWVEFGAPAVAHGKILQVVQDELTTEFTTTSTSDVAVPGLTVTITPSSATSKILVMASCAVSKNDTNYGFYTIYRGNVATGTNLAGSGNYFGRNRSGTADIYQIPSFHYLDSPATTSATTYIVACRVSGGSTSVSTQNHKSTLTVMEVSA